MFSIFGMKPQNFEIQRQKMVNDQIAARGIKDKNVLNALLKVERHRFVPEAYLKDAYADSPLPIGQGQTISQPYIVALMTELLKPAKNKKVLEIGTGSGYQAAVLAELMGEVYSIELIETLGKNASILLKELNYKNIHIKIGDGYLGWKEFSPYDGIIVTCSPTKIPEPLIEQLAEDGLMVIPVGQKYIQELVVVHKKNGKTEQTRITGVRFVPMKDEKGKSY